MYEGGCGSGPAGGAGGGITTFPSTGDGVSRATLCKSGRPRAAVVRDLRGPPTEEAEPPGVALTNGDRRLRGALADTESSIGRLFLNMPADSARSDR